MSYRWSPERGDQHLPLHYPLEEGVDCDKVTLQPSFHQMNKPSDLSGFSEVLLSRSFTILVALLWTHSNSLMSSLY